MPQIKQYFASAKITPQDRGTTAFEQAGRRLGAYAEQIAQGDRMLGEDIAKLWNQAKFVPDLLHAESRGGGGGGGRGGNVHDALDFGARSGWGNGIVSGAFGQNESNPSGEGRSYNDISGSNIRASQEISRGAARLPALVSELIQGQESGNYGKTGVQPNPDVTDEQAAHAGFTVDAPPNDPFAYGRPTYPLSKGGSGLPDILTGQEFPETYGPQPTPAPSLGATIWSGITQAVMPEAPVDTSEMPDNTPGDVSNAPTPNPTPTPDNSGLTDFGTPDNPVQ